MLDYFSNYRTEVKIKGFAVAVFCIVFSLAILSSEVLVPSSIRVLVPIPNYLAVLTLLLAIIVAPSSFNIYKPLLLSILLLCFLQIFHVYEQGKVTPQILLYFYWIIFCGLGGTVWLVAYKYFRLYLITSSILGIIAFFSFVLSLPIPYQIQDYYDHEGWNYVNYGFSYLVLEGFRAIRLCGLFNEPGFLGTMLAMCLVIDGINLKRIGNVIMLIAGCLTFSLAFFLILGAYLFLNLLNNPKYIKTIIILVVLLAILIPYLYKNDMVATLLDRFIIEDGEWAGNNRTDLIIDRYWSDMFKSGNFLFGYGTGYLKYIEYGNVSYKSVIFEYGFVGALLLWGSLLYSAIHKITNKNRMFYIVILCFFLNIFHRPTLFAPCYLLTLFGGIEYIKERCQQQVIKHKDSKRTQNGGKILYVNNL